MPKKVNNSMNNTIPHSIEAENYVLGSLLVDGSLTNEFCGRLVDDDFYDLRNRVIYQAIEDVEAAMKGMLDPEYEEQTIGNAVVKQLFKFSKVGTIAGCMVTEGVIKRGAKVRLLRNDTVIYTGDLEQLKRMKDDVREVKESFECGVKLAKFDDIKEGDILEAFIIEEYREE